MSRTVSSRIAAAAAAVAVVAGGTVFGLGTGAGVGAAAEATCGTQATQVHHAFGGVLNISLTKEVVGDAEVPPGGHVTYKTTITSASPVVPTLSAMADYFPAGFTLESAAVNGNSVTPDVDYTAGTASVTATVGWLINDPNAATFETTYKVPDDAVVGTVYDSGASMTPDLLGEQKWNPIGVCVKVRQKTFFESLTGSVDAAGSSAASSILNDPAGFIADIITGVAQNGSKN